MSEPGRMPSSKPEFQSLTRLMRHLGPLRRMPVWRRYIATSAIVLAFFLLRLAIDAVYPYPYLLFLPAIVIAAIVFDSGSGFLATALSAVLAVIFFIEPRPALDFPNLGVILSAAIFVAVGLLLSTLIETLRNALEAIVESHEALERRESEAREAAVLLETVLESVVDPVSVKDVDGRYVRVNSACATLLGAPKAAIIGRRDADLHPPEISREMDALDAGAIAARRPRVVERLIDLPEAGAARWFAIKSAPWRNAAGETVGVIAVAHDIDARRRSEEEIRAAHGQAEILLRDVNHRVKNHLQAVVAMLAMNARRIDEPAARAALESAVNRLTIMARLYDRLQLRSASEAMLDAREYIESVCADLGPTLIGERPIALTVRADAIDIHAEQAAPLGLLLNEALTNALKHAFPDDRDGAVVVRFYRNTDRFVLEVSDNGVGIPAERGPPGSGLVLMRGLADQLDGEIEWPEHRPGACLRMSFPATSKQDKAASFRTDDV